jgi:hypothetical protein
MFGMLRAAAAGLAAATGLYSDLKYATAATNASIEILVDSRVAPGLDCT